MAFTQNQVRFINGKAKPVLDPEGVSFTQNNVRFVDGKAAPVLDPEASGGEVRVRDTILFGLL